MGSVAKQIYLKFIIISWLSVYYPCLLSLYNKHHYKLYQVIFMSLQACYEEKKPYTNLLYDVSGTCGAGFGWLLGEREGWLLPPALRLLLHQHGLLAHHGTLVTECTCK